MRADQLPSPGPFSNAPRVRFEAAKAISNAQIIARLHNDGSVESIVQLQAFFQACADEVGALATEFPGGV